MFTRRQAYSFIEVLVVMVILGLTSTIALTLFSPKEQADRDTALTQLEQLKNAIIIHNAQHSDYIFQDENTDSTAGPFWWTLLPGVSDPNLTDPWGAYYEHDYYKGAVYSTGPDMIDNNGEGDDLLVFYRPPSAEIIARLPEPESTVNSATPTIITTWRFGGGLTIDGAVIFVDKKPVASRPDVAEYGVLPDPTFTGAAFGSGAGTNYSTAAISFVSPNLTDGIHFVQVLITDSQGNARRASWSFRVDTKPPKIYALNPIPDSTFEYRNPLISCLYHDASGINVQKARFDLRESGVTVVGGWRDYTYMNNPANGFQLSASGLSYRPGITGLTDGDYTVHVEIEDGAGNPDPMVEKSWAFTIKDETAPSIQIHQPVDETAMTTSVDIDLDPTNGVQIEVVGTTERSLPGAQIEVELDVKQVWDGGDEVVDQIDDLGATVTSLTTYSDAAGSFRFPRVTIQDINSSSADEPKNIIRVVATDASPAANKSEADSTVYLFNENNRLQCTVNASPMTTQPNENIHFSVWANKGTTPYSYVWDFDDGFTREGSLMTANTTASLKHTFATTGNFIVTCQITDQRGLTATASQNIYVGTEATTPSLYLDAVPGEVFCGAPDGSTKFHIRIGGKYLGFWRLHVESNPDSAAGYRWYYSSAADKMYQNTDVHPEPDPGGEILWQSASSNDFVVEWDGTDNKSDSPHSFVNNTERRFPSNKMTGSVNRAHYAYLEYIDALGELVETSCPIAVYSSIPSPKGIKITSVKQITNSPELYDIDIDGVPDYTRSNVVDLVAFTPESTNPTHMWVSNYPLELHKVINPANTEITTFQIQVPPDGEIFWNWTMTDGLDYSAVDGSSGWIPIDPTTEAANPVFDWPITAWPESDVTQMFSGSMLTQMSQPWRYPTTVWANMTQSSPNQWSTLGKPGMNMSGEGEKTIYSIFQDAHIFTSTQVESNKLDAGVTSCSIFFDISGPTPSSTPTFTNVEVIDDGMGDYSVKATVKVTAADLSDTGYGLEWGSGLVPDGLVVVQPEGQFARYYSYAGEIDVDFGSLSSVLTNSQLSAKVTYEDNLGNAKVIADSDPMKEAIANISKFTWTLTGGGGYTFYRKSDRSHFLLINTDESAHGKVAPKVNLEGKPTIFNIDASDPKLTHWMNNGATLNQSSGSNAYEDKYATDKSNIDKEHFPNENDRLGHLRARRPWYPWAVEQEATFVVDSEHHYYLIMLKGEVYVEYRVYKGLDSNAACRPTAVAAQPFPAQYIVTNTGIFSEVARVDKVSRQKFNPARVNEAEMWLPGEDSEPANNDVTVYRDLHSSSSDSGPFPVGAAYNKTKCWDELTDLLIEKSTSASHYETYTYRGILMGRDGGTIDTCRYKVTSNSFSAKMGFVDLNTPTAPISTNRYDVTTQQKKHLKLIKAELVDKSLSTYGWGFDIQNTFIEDVAISGYTGLGLGEISGTNFRIKFSDYTNDFDRMTTGTVRPCVLLEFDGTGEQTRVTTSGALVSWDGTLPATSEWFWAIGTPAEINEEGKGGLTDKRAEPDIYSMEINWPSLTGEEGTVTAYVSYIDGQGNQLSHYTTTAAIDSAPPTFLGTAAVTLWSYPGHGLHFSDGGSTFRRSSAPFRWTSRPSFTIDYTAVNDSGSLFREYVGIEPVDDVAADNISAFVADPTTSAGGKEGDASPVNGNVNRWFPMSASFKELMTWDMTRAVQGQNTLYFRFKDDSHNVAPAVTPPDDGQGEEPEVNASLAVDTFPPDTAYPGGAPAAPPISVLTHTANCVARNDVFGGLTWTNDDFPTFEWTSTENVTGGMARNSGIIGANFALDTAGNTTNPPEVYPPMVNFMPDAVQTYDFSVNNTVHTSCGSLGDDGRKLFAMQAVDLVGQIGAKSEVQFVYDKTGPTINTGAFGLQYLEYVAGNHLHQELDVSTTSWTNATTEWDNSIILNHNIEEIVFTCTRGEVAIQGVQLQMTTDTPDERWPTPPLPTTVWNPAHDQETHHWPEGGGYYGHDIITDDHWDWYPDLDGYQNLFRWPEGYNSIWRVDQVEFGGNSSDMDRSFRLKDLTLRDHTTSQITLINNDGANYTSWLDDSTVYTWNATAGSEPVANRVRTDWDAYDDDGHWTYCHWFAKGRRITLRAGESFSVTGLTTQADKLVWQHLNRNRSVRREYTSVDIPKSITDKDWIDSDIVVGDNIDIHSMRIYIDITHTYRGDLEFYLEDPSGNDGGWLWMDTGGETDNLVGWFPTDFTPRNKNALTYRNDPPNSAYNANGTWTLWIYDDGWYDEGTLNGWKLVIYGDLSGYTESSDYTVKVVGAGGWDFPAVSPGAIPANVVSNAVKFDVQWNQISTSATDGSTAAGDAGQNIGVAEGDSIVTEEWEYAVVSSGTDPVWETTNIPHIVFNPPPGTMELWVRAKDLLGNSGPAQLVMGCLADAIPPSGTIAAYANDQGSTANPVADGSAFNTDRISYYIQTVERESAIVAYCYTVGLYGSVDDPEDGQPGTTTVSIGPLPIPDPPFWVQFGGAGIGPNPIPEGHREIKFRVQDEAGSWSSVMTHHCYIDRTAPSSATCDTITDNWLASGTVQINSDGTSFGGSASDNAGGSGIDYVRFRFSPSDETPRNASGTTSWSGSWDPDGKPGSPYNADNANGGVDNQLQVRIWDNAGNASGWMDVQQVYIDNDPPAAPTSVTAGDPNHPTPDYLSGNKNEVNSQILVDHTDGGGFEVTLTPGAAALTSGNASLGVNGAKDWMRWADGGAFGRIRIRERDLAGNQSGDHSIMFNDNSGITNPAAPTMTITNRVADNAAVSYTISDVDGDQGFRVRLQYKFDPPTGAWVDGPIVTRALGGHTFNWDPSASITPHRSGNCIIRLRVRENEGDATWINSNASPQFWLDLWDEDVDHY